MKSTEDRNPPGSKGGVVPLSGADLARMSGLGPCELVRGKLVLASPTSRQHARVEVRFSAELKGYVEPRELGEVLAGEAGIYTSRHPDTVRGADVAFLSRERAARCSPDGFLDVAPDLVVEVLAPRDVPAELETKIAEYLAAGVRLVWVADPAQKTVRVCRPPKKGPGDLRPASHDAPSAGAPPSEAVLSGEEILSGEDVLPGFRVRVSRFFD